MAYAPARDPVGLPGQRLVDRGGAESFDSNGAIVLWTLLSVLGFWLPLAGLVFLLVS